MLFLRSQATFKNNRPVHRWLVRGGVMRPIYDLYVSALPPRQMFAENKLLAYSHSLEAYDLRRTGKRRRFKEVIESRVDALPVALRRHIPQDFPERLRVTRNYVVHYDPKLEQTAYTGSKLISATLATQVLFELTILLELGFSKTDVANAGLENQRIVRAFNLGFLRL